MTSMPRFRTALAVMLALGAALPAAAQFQGPSSTASTAPTTGRNAPVTTVAAAADARSDTRVVLEGNIIAHQFDDYFTFRDPTGTMTVEIGRSTFRRQEVTPQTRVRLHGEVERSVRGRYIDVDRLEIIQ